MSLSDTAIRNAKPTAKPYKLSDEKGLFLLVKPSGGKWWRYKYRFAGKEKLLALGTYPNTSLADARKRHEKARKLLAEGIDPGQEKQKAKRQLIAKHQNTFETIAREWHKSRIHKWTTRHAEKLLRSLELHIFPSAVGTRPITEIRSSELLEVLQKVQEGGAVEPAHRLLQCCGQIFTYAIVTERAEQNPAANLRGALEPIRRNNYAYLKADQLPEFLAKLEASDSELQTKLALKFLMLTFPRTGELRQAPWKEMNLEKAEWRIPPERMKMRDPHIVPLSRQAVNVLEELKELTGSFHFVFPNQHKPRGCMSENTILFALYRMGYHSRATGHGFRSTASTILNEHGFHPDVIERQLAHCERNAVRAAYNHAQYLPERRKMMQWWADYLDAVAKEKTNPRNR
jgi:integrase